MRARFAALLPIVALVIAGGVSFAGAQSVASICKDGSSSSATGRGACSGHGGVDAKATAAAKEAAKPDVKCTDGTTSKPGRGACSHHGGVAKASTTAATTAASSKPASTPAATAAPVSPAKPRETTPAPETKVATARPSSHRGEDNDPTGALAQCKDGMYSHAANHRGACSKHGGVAKFLR